VIYRDRGWRSLLALRACLGFERKLVVLHLIEKDARRGTAAGLVDRAWAFAERLAMRRAVRDAQVLSGWERALYAERFGLPIERLHHLPFAWRIREVESLPPHEGCAVVSVGRVSCDWPTLFAASRDASWPLVVVCTASDLPYVERLNSDGRATVRCDLPREAALALLEAAGIVALCMWDSGRSQGHVRLCQATEAGAPVVASAVRSLEDYVVPGETAEMVPLRDPARLRAAIDRLLEDRERRERLRKNRLRTLAALDVERLHRGDRTARARSPVSPSGPGRRVSRPAPLRAGLAAMAAGLVLAACGAPDQLSQADGETLAGARERLDDAIDIEETLRTSKAEARRLRRGVQRIVSGGALESERLDDFGRAALGELRRLVPSLVEEDTDGSVRALDRPATRAFLRFAESDAARALLPPAREEVELIERTVEESGADSETLVPPEDPTASQMLEVGTFLRDAEGDLRPIWPELAGRLGKLHEGL